MTGMWLHWNIASPEMLLLCCWSGCLLRKLNVKLSYVKTLWVLFLLIGEASYQH